MLRNHLSYRQLTGAHSPYGGSSVCNNSEREASSLVQTLFTACLTFIMDRLAKAGLEANPGVEE